ncbi:MAG: hypothetical protein HQM08_24460 [Candidatus Riflebacteria bacterium]|nr:hypothetical protein [Candidatus Riflebacteria bacterium]
MPKAITITNHQTNSATTPPLRGTIICLPEAQSHDLKKGERSDALLMGSSEGSGSSLKPVRERRSPPFQNKILHGNPTQLKDFKSSINSKISKYRMF